MGTYDLEKEIHHILQDSSKIRDYNAKLRSEYMKLNDEFRRLKVENSKLISQNACTEISLAKSKADNFAKLEEVKSLQSVINLLASGYSDKNNQSDDGCSLLQVNAPNSHVKSSPIGALYGKKNNEPEDSFIKGNTSNSPIQRQKDNSVNLETIFPEPIIPATSSNEISLGSAGLAGNPIVIDKLLSSMLTYSIILFLLIAIIWFIVVKKLWNGWKKSDRFIQTNDLHLQAYSRPGYMIGGQKRSSRDQIEYRN